MIKVFFNYKKARIQKVLCIVYSVNKSLILCIKDLVLKSGN